MFYEQNILVNIDDFNNVKVESVGLFMRNTLLDQTEHNTIWRIKFVSHTHLKSIINITTFTINGITIIHEIQH